MRKEWREALLRGYLDADGCEQDQGFYTVTSVGRCLLAGMNVLALSLGKTTSITQAFEGGTCVIEGRTCAMSPAWTLSIHEDDGRYTEVADGLRWKKMRREVMPASELTTVYDLTVDDDHSFVADGYVVHNCSTFSMAGSREDVWGKEKKFREGQAEQVLSDLFFDYLDVVGKLRPKVSVAENVKGMLMGKARGYCDLIRRRYDELGYDVQLFLLNAATMGVPQTRERVFFVARRRDLGLPKLELRFSEKPIALREVCANLPSQDLEGTEPSGMDKAFWHRTRPGDSYSTVSGGSYFNSCRLSFDRPSPTVTAGAHMMHPEEERALSWVEVCLVGSYPYDYDFLGKGRTSKVYCVGMSVPPVMTAQIAAQIAEQWFGVPAEQIDKAWRGA
jgi:DNA (cytosine-5)-methyltransferase 1